MLVNGHYVFLTFDFEVKLTQSGVKAFGGSEVGPVSSATGRSTSRFTNMVVSPQQNARFCIPADLLRTPADRAR